MSKTYEYSTLEKKYNDLKRDFDYQNTIIKELMDKYSIDGKLKNLDTCIKLYYKNFLTERLRQNDYLISGEYSTIEYKVIKKLLAEFEKAVG